MSRIFRGLEKYDFVVKFLEYCRWYSLICDSQAELYFVQTPGLGKVIKIWSNLLSHLSVAILYSDPCLSIHLCCQLLCGVKSMQICSVVPDTLCSSSIIIYWQICHIEIFYAQSKLGSDIATGTQTVITAIVNSQINYLASGFL